MRILDFLHQLVCSGQMNRLERLYAVNEAIRRRAPQTISAAALADEFEVSRRTIERDLAALRSAGVALYTEYGRSGGQRTAERARRGIFSLSTSEVTALLAAVAAAGVPMPYSDAGVAATRRLLDGLPDATRVDVDRLCARIRTTDDAMPRPARRIKRTVEEAVRRSVVINIGYLDRNDVETRRAVEAHGFYQRSEAWYLIGWCRLRDAGRIFRLDRIRSARQTTELIPDRDLDDVLGWVPGVIRTLLDAQRIGEP